MDTPERTTVAGLTVEQYAGVTAAIAEGIPLARVLDQEQISEEAWRAGETAWREALADGPELQLALLRARRVAEDCLSRAVSPLDADAASWKALLDALARATDPKSVLAPLGITLIDVARLGRRWKERAADPVVAKALAEGPAAASLPANVVVGPVELARFPWSPAPRSTPSTSAPTTPERALLPAPAMERRAPIVVQRASFQLAPPPPAPVPVTPPPPTALEMDETREVDGSALVAQLRVGPLPFDPSAKRKLPPPARAALDALESGATEMVDGSAIRASLTQGALPFANPVDGERQSLVHRIERFAALQRVIGAQREWPAALQAHGFTPASWELERRALAVEVEGNPAYRAIYEAAWRGSGSR